MSLLMLFILASSANALSIVGTGTPDDKPWVWRPPETVVVPCQGEETITMEWETRIADIGEASSDKDNPNPKNRWTGSQRTATAQEYCNIAQQKCLKKLGTELKISPGGWWVVWKKTVCGKCYDEDRKPIKDENNQFLRCPKEDPRFENEEGPIEPEYRACQFYTSGAYAPKTFEHLTEDQKKWFTGTVTASCFVDLEEGESAILSCGSCPEGCYHASDFEPAYLGNY